MATAGIDLLLSEPVTRDSMMSTLVIPGKLREAIATVLLMSIDRISYSLSNHFILWKM